MIYHVKPLASPTITTRLVLSNKVKLVMDSTLLGRFRLLHVRSNMRSCFATIAFDAPRISRIELRSQSGTRVQRWVVWVSGGATELWNLVPRLVPPIHRVGLAWSVREIQTLDPASQSSSRWEGLTACSYIAFAS